MVMTCSNFFGTLFDGTSTSPATSSRRAVPGDRVQFPGLCKRLYSRTAAVRRTARATFDQAAYRGVDGHDEIFASALDHRLKHAMPGASSAFLSLIVLARFEAPLDRFSFTWACEAQT